MRAAAIAALGDRPGDPAVLESLRRRSDELGEHAALALFDRAAASAPPLPPRRSGLRVAQVFLHAELDGDPGRDGAGDHGGVATLLGLLSVELSRAPRVEDVVTVGRGRPADALAAARAASSAAPTVVAGAVRATQRDRSTRRLAPSGRDRAWPATGAAVVGARRASCTCGWPTSARWPAARVARQLGVPVVFTAAPDPHAVLEAAERDGALDRSELRRRRQPGALVVPRPHGRAARSARQPASPCCPAPEHAAELRDDSDSTCPTEPGSSPRACTRPPCARPRRRSATHGAAVGAASRDPPRGAARAAARACRSIVTAGRLHPARGWTASPVRGPATPSFGPAPTSSSSAATSSSRRPTSSTSCWRSRRRSQRRHRRSWCCSATGPTSSWPACFAAASAWAIGGGIYVAGARKEEFGLAIVEAMAAGLVVVAPSTGGPSTYVDDGVDGILVDTGSVAALAAGMRAALRLVDVPGRATATSSRILATYTIEEMAANLADLYADVADHSRRRSPCGCSIISPDYLSHFLPMSAIAAAWQADGGDVTVATGRSIRDHVRAAGLDWRELRMSRGSNAGIAGDGSPDDDLRPFFAATRLGMVPTLRYQADQRGTDLLWEPETVARATIDVVDEVAPDAILVDHLAFAATLGLRAAAIPFTTFVPGHPTQLPVADEVYGHPTRWPSAIAARRRRAGRAPTLLRRRHRTVHRSLQRRAPPARPVGSRRGRRVRAPTATTSCSTRRPRSPTPPDALPMRHALLGSCVRPERADQLTEQWLAPDAAVRVRVVRDVPVTTRRRPRRRRGSVCASATHASPWRPARARLDALGPLPPSWLVAPSLPQVTLLSRAAAAVTHGGNNSVTECLTAAVPMVVLPFSTDQFAIAADLERVDAATAIDPNAPLRDRLHDALDETLGAARQGAVRRIADQLRARPGPSIAVQRLRHDALDRPRPEPEPLARRRPG